VHEEKRSPGVQALKPCQGVGSELGDDIDRHTKEGERFGEEKREGTASFSYPAGRKQGKKKSRKKS